MEVNQVISSQKSPFDVLQKIQSSHWQDPHARLSEATADVPR